MGTARRNNRPDKYRTLTPKLEKNLRYYYQNGDGLTIPQLARRFYLSQSRIRSALEKKP